MTKFLKNADVTGYISQTLVTSSLLKTDSSGKLVAATAGTDYQAPTAALLPTGGTAGQILSKIDATNYNTQWIDNFAAQLKHDVKLGATLAKGKAVYVSSANGTNMIVSAASNASEATSSKTLGLLETGGVTNDIVKVITEGLLAGLDTSTATAGDPVWLGTGGDLIFGLANKPVAPAHLVFIGIVTRVQSVNGEIFVKVQNGFELNEIHNVLLSSTANNDGLFYESSSGLWKNKSIATVLGYTPADVSLTVPTSRTLTINGTAYDLSADRSWTIAPGSSARTETIFTATAGTNTFTIAGGYTVGLVDVYVNGVKYPPADYTASNGTTVVITGLVSGDIVTIINYTAIITALPTSRDVFDYTATAGQTVFTVSGGYAVGLLDVFVNGVKLTSSEYTATNGTSFTLTVASILSDQVQAIRYNASTTGISGSGTANYVPKFTASGTIGNSAITDDGTTVTLVSRALSGISANFTGQLTLGSTITNGTYTYTLPSATGTLALTSQLSSYLPLSGGTLTGALTGTSATFSSTITSSRNDAGNISLTLQNSYINQGNLINFIHNSGGTTTNGYIGHGGDSTGNFVIINNGIAALSMARATGAATFSNSVTADGLGSGISALSSWGASPVRPIIEGREGNAISNYVGLPEMYYTSNAYYNGTAWIRKSANPSINMVVSGYNNNFLVQSAPTGAAGGTVSFSTLFYINGSNGNVLIGTTTDGGGYKLQVNGLGRFINTSTILNFGQLDANNIYFQALNTASDTSKGFVWYGTSEYMRITSGGNVGIGLTSNIDQKLTVSGRIRCSPDGNNGGDMAVNDGGLAFSTIGATPIQFWTSNYSTQTFKVASNGDIYANNNAALFFGASALTYLAGGNTSMSIAVNGSERMRITSAGDVCIGMTSALQPASGRGSLSINGSSSSILSLGIGGSVKGYMYAGGTTLGLEAVGSQDMTFAAGSAERMRIRSDGAVVIGRDWGNVYSMTSGGGTGTAIVDTGITYNSGDYGGFSRGATYLVVFNGNPNAGGSGAYFAQYTGIISIYTGWSGSAVTTYINYTQLASGNNIGALTLTPVFWNGSSESSSVNVYTSGAQIRLKIAGYNSSYTGQDQSVYLKRLT